MKKALLYLFLLLVAALPARADHIMGGEITWECTATGQYRIKMKIFRDCTGIPLTGSQNITLYNYPSVGQSISIMMNEISSIDVSPDCSPWPGAQQLGCGAGPPFNTMLPASEAGSVVQNSYESAPITLNGTPPPAGWVFTWSSCCRNQANTNLVTPTSVGHTLRAIMFPYTPPGSTTPQAANPCYDNSPKFNESPSTVICTGYPFTYNHNASDVELDSLYYDWAQPLGWGFGSGWNPPTSPPVLSFATGYSYTSPLPGPAQNGSNVPAVLNNASGEIKFTSFTSGGFVYVVKVEAWKCGQKVAEIYRDIQTILLACSGTNSPPSISVTASPNSIPVTQIPGTATWEATASPGDLIEFTMQALDVQFQPVTFLPQNVSFSASGGQLGVPLNSSTSGCINAPCATIIPTGAQVGFTSAQQNNVTFSWLTDCNHLAYQTNCGTTKNTYTFVLKMADDFCPAPAISLATLIITIEAEVADPPDFQCVGFNSLTNELTLNWVPPTDTGGGFISYIIYYQAPGSGSFTAIDTVTNWNTAQHIINGFGTGQYYVRTESQCGYLSETSDTLSVIDLVVTPFPPVNSEIGFLNWNRLGSDPNTVYEVWAEAPAGSGSIFLLGTTTDTMFVDTVTFCNTNINYQVRVTVGGSSCGSTLDGALFSDNTNNDVVVLDSASVNSSNQSVLAWDTAAVSPDIVEYYILMLNTVTGLYDIIDTVQAAGLTFPYVVPNSNPSDNPETFKVISVDSCGNQSDDLAVIPHTTILLRNYLDKCESKNTLSWTPYEGFGNIGRYNLFVTITDATGASTPKSLLYQSNGSTFSYTQNALVNNYTYCYEVQAIDTVTGATSTSNRLCILAQVPNKSRILYLANATHQAGGVELYAFIDGTADVISFDIERSGNPVGPFIPVGSVPKPAAPPWVIAYNDFGANASQRRYYYRIAATDSCGSRDTVSNLARNILLEVEARGNLSNQLRWNPYEQWNGEVGLYNIYRSVDNEYSFQLVATRSGNDTSYLDLITGFPNGNGKFCYYVEAVEVNNPLGFVDAAGNPFRSRSNEACTIQEARMFLPNAFYPESAVLENQWFGPSNVFAQPGTYRFYIMNRWGEMVFETNDPAQLWDGNHEGEKAPLGAYVYFLKYSSLNGLPVEQRGTFTLIR